MSTCCSHASNAAQDTELLFKRDITLYFYCTQQRHLSILLMQCKFGIIGQVTGFKKSIWNLLCYNENSTDTECYLVSWDKKYLM